ncbi:MAG: TonB-dependent receptor [Cytophagales bacterium]|uniref:SusC/RagA family TonB-linked outer membrane protein n=1 Tax=Cyclobacterium marinum TaxID=104 RepID=UPI0030D94D40|nr:TonB-dependent receptor [Cytophagales bacterium]|tara:strand:- start:67968 stop:71060 length:3093 start_codon:yes stop_codon:yes gene_type:complete
MKKNCYQFLDSKQLFYLLAAMLLSFASYAQSTISGVVRSEGDNETIPGVSVLVKGTTRGTVTDLDGKFQVEAAAGEVLSVSYIGYATKEITIQGGQTQYDITLASSMSDLTEVVVVGYGSQLKKEITGSVQTIDGDDLMDIPATQIAQKLQGQLAGVQINQTTGRPGQGMNVRIRGQLSVSAGSDPLYVVDGFPITGDISTLNPDEIQDITILKDAASTSLYGSRAANGVVLITTKRGKEGQSSVSLNVYRGLQNVPHYNRLEMMDAVEFAQFKKEYYEDAGRPVPEMFQNPSEYEGKTQDWYDALLQTAPISNYNLTINSNTEKMRTSVVAGYFDQEGVVLNTDYERFSLRINSDYKASEKISMGFNIAPQYVRDNTPRTDGSRGTGILFNALHAWPNMPIYDDNGELTYYNRFPSETGNIFAYPNYVRSALEITNETKQTNLLSNAYVQYEPIEGLVVKSTINAEIRNSKFFNFTPSTASAGINIALPAVASSIRDHYENFSWLNENTVTYSKSINDHNFQLLGGFTNQKFRRERTRVAADTYADDRLPTIQGAININRGGTLSDVQEWSLTSFLSRLTYNFKGKYLMTAAIRADGSSRFGAENRWGVFPSVSAGWVLSDEGFLNTSDKVSFAKIRGSFGVTGNNNIGNYTQYALVNNTVNAVFDNTVVPGAAITSLSNPYLGWETTRQFDIGLDLGLFDDRITFIYDFYSKNTTNLLYNVQIPQEAGFGSFTDNIGEIKFWGHEFSISSRNTEGRLVWTTNANISFNRNRVEALAEGIDRVYGSYHITQVGQPFGQFYGLNKLGNYMDQEDLDNSPQVPGRSTVGSIKLEDVNGDGIISIGGDNDDRTIIGNPFPDFTYGITNNFTYGKWDLSIIASGSYGNQLYMRHLYSTANLDGVFNMVAKATDRFRSPEDPGEGIFGTTVGGGNVTGIERDWANSNFVWDASFFSIKNITLGYDIGKIANVVKAARLYASVQNVYIFTPYWGGGNPEVSQDNGSGDGGNLSPGVDLTGYPVPRTFTIGANITF